MTEPDDGTEGRDAPTSRPDAPIDAPTGRADGPAPEPTEPTDDDAAGRGGRARAIRAVGASAAALLVILVAVAVSRSQPQPDPIVAAPPPASPSTTVATIATTTSESTTTTIGTTTTTRAPRNAHTGPPGPLTGAPVERAGYDQRPALVVKIDNYDPDARPQAGITAADVVYEEKVEGPYSRFAAVFQGTDAQVVGPVRSARSTDVAIVGPLNTPLFAYSGANGGFLQLLAMSPLIDVGAARNGSYYRGGDKAMPHNLYTSTAGLYGGRMGGAPAPLFPFRGAKEAPGPGARAAMRASYHFGGGVTAVSWVWDPEEGGWVRTQNGSLHLDTGNWPITVDNVVIEYVPYAASSSQDLYGNPIPEAQMHGEGRGWVLTGGAAIPVTWSKFALETRTDYYGPDGQPVRFAPGRTWVALVPVEVGASIAFADGTLGG
jgi:hypothetical protein